MRRSIVSIDLLLTPKDEGYPENLSDYSNLNNYISGGVLSVWLQTSFGTGPAGVDPTIINTLEVSGDIIGTMAPVPEPATMLLFGTGLAGLAGTRIRRKKK